MTWINKTKFLYSSANKAGALRRNKSIETFIKKLQKMTSACPFSVSQTANIFVFLAATFHIYRLCCFSFFLLFIVVCRVSHSKAFPLQSKPGRNSHSSNRYVSVVFAHRRNTEKRGQRVILAVFGLPSKASYHPRATLSPTQRPEAERGQQNPCRINPKSSNGARGGKTLHTATKFKDHHLSFRYLG